MRRVVVFGGIAVALLHPAQWRAPDRIGSPRVAHASRAQTMVFLRDKLAPRRTSGGEPMNEVSDEHDVRAHGFIRGRVQGVWFRESTRQRAAELGLAGFVRNLPDGRVEATFEGPIEAVKLARAFVEEGPQHARVDSVEGFEIEQLPTTTPTRVREFLIR